MGGRDASYETSVEDDTCTSEGFTEVTLEGVLALIEEGGEGNRLIIPTPSPSERKGVFECGIADDVSGDIGNAIFPNGMGKGSEIVGIDHGVHASADDYLRGVGDVEAGLIGVVGAEIGESGGSGEQFLTGGGTHALAAAVIVEGSIGGDVIDIETELCAVENLVLQQSINAAADGGRKSICWLCRNGQSQQNKEYEM